MAPREPDKSPIQVGGTSLSSLLRRKKPAPREQNIAVEALKAAKAKAKPRTSDTRRAAVASRQDIIKTRLATRRASAKQRVQAGKEAKIAAVRALRKKAAPAPVATRRAIVSSDQKTIQIKARTASIKNKAKVNASKAGNTLRIQLKAKANANKVTKSQGLQTKLDNLQNARNDKMVKSKQGVASDNMKGNGASHKNGIAGTNISNTNQNAALGKRAQAKSDLDAANAKQIDLNGRVATTGSNRNAIDVGIQGATGRREAAKGEANKASANAETGRAGAASTAAQANTQIGLRDQAAAGIVGTNTKIGNEPASNAAAAATGHDAMRKSAAGTASKRSADQRGADNSRAGAAADVVTHSGEIATATGRKNANEAALGGIETAHEARIASMKATADGGEASVRGNLNDAKASGSALGSKASAATSARQGKEGELASAGSAISSKNSDIAKAKADEGVAKTDHDARVAAISSTTTANTAANNAAPPAKIARDTAAQAAAAATPSYPASDLVQRTRKDQISNTELPNAQAKKAAATGIRDSLVSARDGPDGPVARRGANTTELAGIATTRGQNVSKDTMLHGRQNTTKTAHDNAVANSAANAIDLSVKKAGKQAHLDHAGEVDNVVKTRLAEAQAGITMDTQAATDTHNSATRSSATLGGTTAGRTHATAKRGAEASVEVSATAGGKRAGAKGELDRATATQYDLNGRKVKTSGERDTATAGRNDAAARRDNAKGQGASAAGSAESGRQGAVSSADGIRTNTTAHDTAAAAIAPIKAKKAAHESAAAGAGADALHSDGLRSAASGTANRRGNDRDSAKSSREHAANDATTHRGERDAAISRKGANEDALKAVESDHDAHVAAMEADADSSANGYGGHLDEANASGAKQKGDADRAKVAREGKEGDAATNSTAAHGKEGEVVLAKGHEASAKNKHDADVAEKARREGELNGLGAQEPGLDTDRNLAHDAAEGATPKREPGHDATIARKHDIEASDLPAARKKKADAETEANRLDDAINGPGGLEDETFSNYQKLSHIGDEEAPLRNNDIILHSRLSDEKTSMDANKLRKKTVDEEVHAQQDSVLGHSQHMDDIGNVIKAKKIVGPEESSAHNDAIVTGERATASSHMGEEGKKHSLAESAAGTTRTRMAGEKGDLEKLTGENTALKKHAGELQGSIGAETAHRGQHENGMQDARGREHAYGSEADSAAGNAERARGSHASNDADIAAKGHSKEDLEGQIAGEKARIAKNKGDAEVEGGNAAHHKEARDSAGANAKKRGDDAAAADGGRHGSQDEADTHASELSSAQKRKAKAEADERNVESAHDANMKKMEEDADVAVREKEGALGDAQTSAGRRHGESDEAAAARKAKEDEAAAHKAKTKEKEDEVSGAHDSEGRARADHDAAVAAREGHEADMNKRSRERDAAERERNAAEGEAEGHRPKHDIGDEAGHSRQKQIDEEMKAHQKEKDDANAAKEKAMKDSADAQTQKEKLPHHEDTKSLHDKDAELSRRKSHEEENLDEMKKNKHDVDEYVANKKEESMAAMLAKDMAASLIASMLAAQLGKLLDPGQVVGPGITSPDFQYPGASGASGATGASGAQAIGVLNLGDGSDPTTMTGIGADGLGGTGGTGASGVSGPGPDSSADYTKGYNTGKVAGAQDGQRDGTADATTANSKIPSTAEIATLQSQLSAMTADQTASIEKQVASATNDAYCREIQAQGIAQGIDITKAYPECAKFFKRNPIRTSGPTIATEAGQEKTAVAMSGGYMEDIDGVMQFGGAIVSGPVEPSGDYEIGYADGYKVGYKPAYTQAYSLTLAIKITKKKAPSKKSSESGPVAESGPVVEKGTTGYDDLVVAAVSGPQAASGATAEMVATASAPIASGAVGEMGAKLGTASAPVASGASAESGPRAEKGKKAKVFTESSSLGPQAGGALKEAKRKYTRGKTLMQHARLLEKIIGKTISV
jgi:hypothetical protein